MLAGIPLAAWIDLVLGVLIAEAIGMTICRRWLRRGLPYEAFAPNLAAGFFLVSALRCAVHDQPLWSIALCLALAGMAHVVDLVVRSRSHRALVLDNDVD